MAAPTVIHEVSNPAATTNTTVYTCPANRRARVRVRGCAVSAATVRLYIVESGGSPDATNALVYDHVLSTASNTPAFGGTEPIYMSAGMSVVVYSSSTGLACSVNGYEDDAPY